MPWLNMLPLHFSLPQAARGSHDDTSALPGVKSDTDLMKGAPPSYSDALRLSSAISGTRTDVPPTELEEPVPPYLTAECDPFHPPTANDSNLPYPNTTDGGTPYPPVGTVADIASTPYPSTQAPYPQGDLKCTCTCSVPLACMALLCYMYM